MRRLLPLIVAALLAASTPGGVSASQPTLSRPPVEPAPELLLQPPPGNETQRLIEEARQQVGLCGILASLDAIEEPDPRKVTDLHRWAALYQSTISTLDPRRKVEDLSSNRTNKEVDLPPDLLAAMRVQQQAAYAYFQRLATIITYDDAGSLTADEVRRLIDTAWVRLANSAFYDAHRYVEESRDRYCGG